MQELVGKYLKGDKGIWAIAIFLFIYSLLAVYSTSRNLAFSQEFFGTNYYLFRHSMMLFLGFLAIFVFHHVKILQLKKYVNVLMLLIIPLLIATLFWGVEKSGATRSLEFFQTSELAKFGLISYLALAISKYQSKIKSFKDIFVPIILPTIVTCMLILPEDLSTTALLFTTALTLMFIGRMRISHIFGMVSSAAICIFTIFYLNTIGIGFGRVGTWESRLSNFVQGIESQQTAWSKTAIAESGLLYGKGPGKSEIYSILPQSFSDFIYAIIIEEYGLLFGGLGLMALYFALLWKGVQIFRKSRDAFGALLAIGLSLCLCLQAMVTMAVTVGLLPPTGITLPFVSWGGTSIILTGVMMGTLISLSRYIERKPKIKKAKLSNA